MTRFCPTPCYQMFAMQLFAPRDPGGVIVDLSQNQVGLARSVAPRVFYGTQSGHMFLPYMPWYLCEKLMSRNASR